MNIISLIAFILPFFSIFLIVFFPYIKLTLSIDGQFGEMKPHEWGDFLVGVFGPASFFMLAAAYFAQRQELSLQRDELRLTRVTLSEQKNELARNATESERQNFILSQQIVIEQWKIVTSELETICAWFFRTIKGHFQPKPGSASRDIGVAGHSAEYIPIELPRTQEIILNVIHYLRNNESIKSLGFEELGDDILYDRAYTDRKREKNRTKRDLALSYAEAYLINWSSFRSHLPSGTGLDIEFFDSTFFGEVAEEMEAFISKYKGWSENGPVAVTL